MAGQKANARLLCPHTNKPAMQTVDHPVFWCGICCVKLKTPFIAIQHLMGRSHRTKVDYSGHRSSQAEQQQQQHQQVEGQFLEIRCNVCNREFDSVREIEVHLKGKQHLANLKHGRPHDNLFVNEKKDLTQLWPVSKGSQNEDYIHHQAKLDIRPRCEICNLEFNSTIVRANHYKGKRHAANLLVNGNNNNDNNNYVKNWYDTSKNQTTYVPTMNSMIKHRVSSPNADTVVLSKQINKQNQHFDISTSDIKLSCKECNMSFNSPITASHHFKGRKHAAMMDHLKSPNDEQSASKRKHSGELHEQYDLMMNLINDRSTSVNSDGKKIKVAPSSSTLTPPEEDIPYNDRRIFLENQFAATQHFTDKRHAKYVARKEAFTGQQHAKDVARKETFTGQQQEVDVQREVMNRWQNGDRDKKANVGRGRFGIGRGHAGIERDRNSIERGHDGIGRGRGRADIWCGGAGIGRGSADVGLGIGNSLGRTVIGYNIPTDIMLGYPGIVTLGQSRSHLAGNMLRNPNIIPVIVNSGHPLAGQFKNVQPSFPGSSSSARNFPY